VNRFSTRNALGWIGGAAALVVSMSWQLNLLSGPFFTIVVVAGIVAAVYWIYRQLEQWGHGKRLREFALTLGWTYSETGGLRVNKFTGFPFGIGTEREVRDVIEGNYAGFACASYTYRFRNQMGGKRAGDQIFTVTELGLETPYPRLDLMPENIGTRLLSTVGLPDIDLESAEFNRTWRVMCADRRYAVDFLDPRMMQLLLTASVSGVSVRVDGNRIFAWSAGLAPVKELNRRLDLAVGVAKRIPAHVERKYYEADAWRREALEERERNAPTWAKTGGILNSRRYTGIGMDEDGDGIDDSEQRLR